MAAGDPGREVGDVPPQAGEARVPDCSRRQHEHGLPRLFPAAAGLADAQPVRGLVAGGPEPLGVDVGLGQQRAGSEPALPVPGQLPGRHPEAGGGQIARTDPGQDQEPGVAHHPDAVPVPAAPAPADPCVPAGQRPGRAVEQQAGKPAAAAVVNEAADVRAERPLMAEIVVAVHQRVPQLPAFGVLGRNQAQRPEVGEPGLDPRLRAGGGGPDRAAVHAAALALDLRGQGQDAAALQLLQHRQAGADPEVSPGRHPVQLLADEPATACCGWFRAGTRRCRGSRRSGGGSGGGRRRSST